MTTQPSENASSSGAEDNATEGDSRMLDHLATAIRESTGPEVVMTRALAMWAYEICLARQAWTDLR